MNILDEVIGFFISNAQANTGAANTGPAGNMTLFIMLGLFVVFIYFSVWRPQNKRAKEQKELLNAIAVGDEVLTIGGVLGTVNKVTDTYVILSVADNVKMTLLKSSIANALPKGTLKSI